MFRLPLLVGYYICALFIHVQTSPLGISLVITSVRYLSMFRLPLLVFLWLLHLCVIYPCSDFPSLYFFGYYICALFIHVQVKLSRVISTSEARGAVEKWLLQVEEVMLISIRDVLEASREVNVHSVWMDGGGGGIRDVLEASREVNVHSVWMDGGGGDQRRARGIARGKCTQCVDGWRGGGIRDVLEASREVNVHSVWMDARGGGGGHHRCAWGLERGTFPNFGQCPTF